MSQRIYSNSSFSVAFSVPRVWSDGSWGFTSVGRVYSNGSWGVFYLSTSSSTYPYPIASQLYNDSYCDTGNPVYGVSFAILNSSSTKTIEVWNNGSSIATLSPGSELYADANAALSNSYTLRYYDGAAYGVFSPSYATVLANPCGP